MNLHPKVQNATILGIAAVGVTVLLAALGAIPATDGNQAWLAPIVAALTTLLTFIGGYATSSKPASKPASKSAK